jgi:hypothetical protein
MTGHLCVRLMVDEEFEANQVRYVIHIGGCAPGAGAIADLLLEVSPRALVRSMCRSCRCQSMRCRRRVLVHSAGRVIRRLRPSYRRFVIGGLVCIGEGETVEF